MMKSYLILFKTVSIPFSFNKQDDYIKEWDAYIDKLTKENTLQNYTFLKKGGVFISGKQVEAKSYIPHKDIISGYMIINTSSTRKAIEICKECPVFVRNGELQIKEFSEKYINL